MMLWLTGCQGRSSARREVDARLARLAKSGSTAFAEGFVDAARQDYRKALRRAWAMDDPLESGANAYNLAACLTSQANHVQARDWLLDARMELCRAGASTGNVWLLEAAIAQDEFRYEDASRFLQLAQATDPPCGDPNHVCGSLDDPCRDRCVAKIPCVGAKRNHKRLEKECEKSFQSQIYLAYARSAVQQYELGRARANLQLACKFAEEVCSHELQAELQNVAGQIHIAAGQYLRAAHHFDREATHLRLAGNYRVIPASLRLAAAAYQQAGDFEQAATRLLRAARVLLGRGQTDSAWQVLLQASEVAELTGGHATAVRLACTAHELEQTLADSGKSLSQEAVDSGLTDSGMLAEQQQAASQSEEAGL